MVVITPLDMATRYTQERGWRVIPVPAGSKRPILEGWERLRLDATDLPAHFASDVANVGVLNGEPSGWQIDVDLDACEAVEAAAEVLPPTDLVSGRPSKPRSHWFYRLTAPQETRQFKDVDKSMLVELRSTGTQTLLPFSRHPDGEEYRWERGKKASEIAPAVLLARIGQVAAAAILARHWPAKGSRHDADNALCGVLLRNAWTVEDTAGFACLVARLAGDEEWRERGAGAKGTARKLEDGRAVTGAPTLADLLTDGEKVVAKVYDWLDLRRSEPYAINAENAENTSDDAHQGFSAFIAYDFSAFPTPDDAMYYGVAGEIVRAIEPHTEASPVALLAQLLASFGNAAGRHVHYLVEAERHYANLFVLVVGDTSKSRKGTSWGRVAHVLRMAVPGWLSVHVTEGLSSGEGVVHALRDVEDDELPDGAAGELLRDKRLLVREGEFASVRGQQKRDGNTLSAILRNGWDGVPLGTLTKNSPERATDAHLSVIGHITQDELVKRLTSTDASNGFANRFLYVATQRTRLLPHGGDLDALERDITPHIQALCAALDWAKTPRRLAHDKEAYTLWEHEYERLSTGHPGLFGAVTARAEAQVTRIALIYAMLDRAHAITAAHLHAALALWRYCEDSACHIFGDLTGDTVADTILDALRATAAGMTRDEMHELFAHNVESRKISAALATLLKLGLARTVKEETGKKGRPPVRWFAVEKRTR